MAALDWCIVLAFAAYAVRAGLRARRQASRNLEAYFLAGRDAGEIERAAHAQGQASLRDDALESLVEVVDLLQSEPDKFIRIEGHTDSTGNSDTNLKISQQRADAVLEALVQLGVDPARITAIGMGQDFPIATNESDEGRAQNRRVDVILLDDLARSPAAIRVLAGLRFLR